MFKKLAEGFYVAPQLLEEDFTAAKSLGIKTIINNRPDGEAEDQLPHEAAEATATEAGLAYQFVPVVSGGIFPDHAAQFAKAVDASEGPILAYCRSGTRSTHLWAMQAARSEDPDTLIAAARSAGYDISGMRPLLEQIRAHNKSQG
ncbi:MAG: TIGR01244 family sulfur transferase [Pseudomonadota bacterium]